MFGVGGEASRLMLRMDGDLRRSGVECHSTLCLRLNDAILPIGIVVAGEVDESVLLEEAVQN